MRYFNTEGVCRPGIHYMVRLDSRMDEIKRLYVDRGKYFVTNRGRQYGKTTTLRALERYLKKDYLVVFLDFQGIGTEAFADEKTFAYVSAKEFLAAVPGGSGDSEDSLWHPLSDYLESAEDRSLRKLFTCLSRICESAEKPLVLIINEVDSASNNQVFIEFLAQFRRYYLDREEKPTFHSVILAGVYDIKNLKLKIRSGEEYKYNSPWNIAADFTIDMNFSAEQIATMLQEYEKDRHTGMDVEAIIRAKVIFAVFKADHQWDR